ncbi:MAG: ABC transporter substrate-binding protein [Leptolyngbyaceae bacterium]|nr:ABC transporter substrate-binding protein [Leptolyngbyaceae bacterium]
MANFSNCDEDLRCHLLLNGIAIAFIATLSGSCGDRPSPPSTSDNPPDTVTILGSITGEGQDTIEAIFQPFTEATGIQVIYEGTDAFATLLPVRVEAGNAPDLALFPQPGLMADLARSGDLIPLDSVVSKDQLTAAYGDEWLQLGTVDNAPYGLWARADLKSLVWYRPDVFSEKGYDIPATWEEMLALSDQMAADGTPPWCIGIESGAATGWVGTDWIEDILLRTSGPDVYDQWVQHEIPFTSPEIVEAFQQFGAIALNPDYVYGGSVGIISTPFGDAPLPLFTDPPGCYLHRQTNFIATFFPDDVVVGEDVDVFLLPPIDPEFGTPLLVAGTAFAMLNDREEVRAVVEYLLTPEPHEIWVSQENYISPHQQVSLDAYADPFMRTQAELLANAETIRFDGSDLMPGAVGTGTFWTGIVDYVGGTDTETVLERIEESWPKDNP